MVSGASAESQGACGSRAVRRVVIVGAGPAGLASAIAAARSGRHILLVEKNSEPGRKLLLAGGGRANLWDPALPAIQACPAYGRAGRFLHQALAAFDFAEFLSDLGVECERRTGGPRQGVVFVRGGSRRLLEALLAKANELGVEMIRESPVRAVTGLPAGGFEVRTDRRSCECDHLVLCTGGLTYPTTGSTGDGYGLAEALGHAVDPPRPALGDFVTAPCFTELAGFAVADAALVLRRDERRIAAGRGPLLFTHRGISGPAVIDLSLELARAVQSDKEPRGIRIAADLLPGTTAEEATAEFLALARSKPRSSSADLGRGTALGARLTNVLARLAGFPPERRLGQASHRDFAALAAVAKSLSFNLAAPLDPSLAMVTCGGVATAELDARTMESRIRPGLFLAGELLSPAGPCGGYNLLMAFATGWAAGNGAQRGQPHSGLPRGDV